MKNALKIAFVYIGLVIGAGFASGREILTFFNFYSLTDLSGVILATLLLIAVCYVILRRCVNFGYISMDEYISAIIPNDFAARFIRILMLCFMFCSFFVMLAGCGSLFNMTLNAPPILGIVLLAVICFCIFAFDASGIVAVNSILVPLMLIGIIFLCTRTILFADIHTFLGFNISADNILTSAICYVSYNTLTAAAVLIPLQKYITSRSMRLGAYIGGGALGLLIFILWFTLSITFDHVWDSEIPMLSVAEMSGRVWHYVYGAVLFMSILTTAASSGFGLLAHFNAKYFKTRLLYALALCCAAVPLALFGFSNLVSYVYTTFGYLGLLWMIWLLIKR